MHEHKSSVPNRGHCNFVFKSIAFHRTGEFGFDEKCTSIYHESRVFGLAALLLPPVNRKDRDSPLSCILPKLVIWIRLLFSNLSWGLRIDYCPILLTRYDICNRSVRLGCGPGHAGAACNMLRRTGRMGAMSVMGIMGTPGCAGLLVTGVQGESHRIGSPPSPVERVFSDSSDWSDSSDKVRGKPLCPHHATVFRAARSGPQDPD